MIRLPDSLIGALFVIGGIAVIITASQMEGLGGMAVGPGLMPLLVGVGFVIFGAALFLQGLAELSDLREGRVRLFHGRPNPLFPIIIVLTLIAYVPLLYPVGFVPVTFLFVAIVVRAGGGPLITSIVFSAAMTAAIYLIFSHLLRVPLPSGLLG